MIRDIMFLNVLMMTSFSCASSTLTILDMHRLLRNSKGDISGKKDVRIAYYNQRSFHGNPRVLMTEALLEKIQKNKAKS